MASESLPITPYWLVNVDPALHLSECPPFLQNVSAKDISIISTPDSAYHRLTWPEVQKIIEANRIDRFQRVPSALRRYLEYTYKLRQQYGSVMAFILQERLRWSTLSPVDGRPFACLDDFKILQNDWPYGIDSRITHLVIWTKFDLPDDAETGDLTSAARAQIDDFVAETFYEAVPREHVIWFKNWKSLKSVHAVEHFHVMLYAPDEAFVDQLTGNDIPLSKRV